MTHVEGWDNELGPIVAIPEPFWNTSWRTWFRSRPACYPCRVTFKTRERYEQHYLSTHYRGRGVLNDWHD